MIDNFDDFLHHYHLAVDVPYDPHWDDMFGSPTGAITDQSISKLSRSHDRLNRRIVIFPAGGQNTVFVQTFPDEKNFHRVDHF